MGSWLKRLVDRQEKEEEVRAAKRLSMLADQEANQVLQANIARGEEIIRAVKRGANHG